MFTPNTQSELVTIKNIYFYSYQFNLFTLFIYYYY